MGFFKFLSKRKEDKGLEGLDLPPAPPLPPEEFDEKFPDLPEFPEINAQMDDKGFKFDFPNEDGASASGQYGQPAPAKEDDFMDFQKIEAEMPKLEIKSMPDFNNAVHAPEQEAMQEEEPQPASIKPARRLFSREIPVTRHHVRSKREVYIRVDNFRAALDNISMVRGSLRNSEEALTRMESIKSAKDKSFDKFKSSLEDLQKKLIFIDKTLFKGD